MGNLPVMREWNYQKKRWFLINFPGRSMWRKEEGCEERNKNQKEQILTISNSHYPTKPLDDLFVF